ncbi:MAG: hypothetical protein ABR540_13185 [Acidimicrobiales bacterium]
MGPAVVIGCVEDCGRGRPEVRLYAGRRRLSTPEALADAVAHSQLVQDRLSRHRFLSWLADRAGLATAPPYCPPAPDDVQVNAGYADGLTWVRCWVRCWVRDLTRIPDLSDRTAFDELWLREELVREAGFMACDAETHRWTLAAGGLTRADRTREYRDRAVGYGRAVEEALCLLDDGELTEGRISELLDAIPESGRAAAWFEA